MKLKDETMISSRGGKLARSHTINTDTATWCPEPSPPPPTPGKVDQDVQNGTVDAHSGCLPPVPGPSCRALRHAVSALSRLDDFICEKLGEGFFAEVFKVTHRMTGAVQVLKMNKIQENKPNVLRELQLMNRLSHQNILRFLGVCVHEGQLHALTEYINGGDLEQLLGNKAVELPWTVRVKIAHDITMGMVYLHSRGIMHRDLTSKNVLIRNESNEYTAVVGDFGLSAKIPDPQSKKQLSTVGSPFWMAPEVINGLKYNELADVFSFGVICCEITARVTSDPDEMPRTNKFGIDYRAFSDLIDYCPLDFLRLAFTCAQIDANKRPTFCDAEVSTLQIFENLKNDNIIYNGMERRNSMDGSTCYMRSRSADNILEADDNEQFSESELDDDETVVTPSVVGEAMSKDDPFYEPSISNPFESMAGYSKGLKILGKSFGDVYSVAFELPSPSSPTTPPCTPNYFGAAGQPRRRSKQRQKSQSLPSSPVLLRKAAERLHQESIHGSNSKRSSVNTNRYSFSAYGMRSKSVFFPEAVAQRLQFEMYDTGSPYHGRSREGSTESDTDCVFNNTYPLNKSRRHSQTDALSVQRKFGANNSSVSSRLSSRQDSIDEAGDNLESMYPSLSYAADTGSSDQFTINNNLLPSPSNSSLDESMSSVSSYPDLASSDPWSLRRETLTDSAIIEETQHSTAGIMETSV